MPEHSVPALFIFGHQRSGTNLLFELLRSALQSSAYNEDHPEAFDDYRLRSVETIRHLIQKGTAPSLFKPVSETLKLTDLLANFPGAKGILIFRNPLRVAISGVREFAGNEAALTKDIWSNFIEGRLPGTGVCVPDWSPIAKIVARYRGRFRQSADFASKLALHWLLVHTTLIALGIEQNPRVVLLAYEDLLAAPERVAALVSMHLNRNIGLDRIQEQPLREPHYFTDPIDLQLADDCMAMFEQYRAASAAQGYQRKGQYA